MKKLILCICFISFHMLLAQNAQLKVEVSSDTILIGNYFEVKFILQNVDGEFIAPQFPGLKIIAGPNRASSYSFINGTINQSSSYVYYLKPDLEGDYIIDPAILKTSDGELKTPQLNIFVAPNPNNIRQNPSRTYEMDEPLIITPPTVPQAPKKKVYKI